MNTQVLMPERHDPNIGIPVFARIVSLTTDNLLAMSDQTLRDLHADINRLWNMHLYPIVVAVLDIQNQRSRADVSTNPLSALRGMAKEDVAKLVRSLLEK